MSDGFTMPIAGWQVSLDGKDLTEVFRPRLISATIEEKREDEADQLDIVVHDKDGDFGIPKPGAVLKVMMGWEQGSGIPAVGLLMPTASSALCVVRVIMA